MTTVLSAYVPPRVINREILRAYQFDYDLDEFLALFGDDEVPVNSTAIKFLIGDGEERHVTDNVARMVLESGEYEQLDQVYQKLEDDLVASWTAYTTPIREQLRQLEARRTNTVLFGFGAPVVLFGVGLVIYPSLSPWFGVLAVLSLLLVIVWIHWIWAPQIDAHYRQVSTEVHRRWIARTVGKQQAELLKIWTLSHPETEV